MEFKKEDENYIYSIIGKNVKKYRKQKGLTQVQLAEQIDYSLSFVSSIESKKYQTFSLGALYRISLVLGVDMYKLCIDEEEKKEKESKYIEFICSKCNYKTDIPNGFIHMFLELNHMCNNDAKIPILNCPKCKAQMLPSKTEDITE